LPNFRLTNLEQEIAEDLILLELVEIYNIEMVLALLEEGVKAQRLEKVTLVT
jgi:hypothetical protein